MYRKYPQFTYLVENFTFILCVNRYFEQQLEYCKRTILVKNVRTKYLVLSVSEASAHKSQLFTVQNLSGVFHLTNILWISNKSFLIYILEYLLPQTTEWRWIFAVVKSTHEKSPVMPRKYPRMQLMTQYMGYPFRLALSFLHRPSLLQI